METIKVKCELSRELAVASGRTKYGQLDVEITPEILSMVSAEVRSRLAKGWSVATASGRRAFLPLVQWTSATDVPAPADVSASFEAAIVAESEALAKRDLAVVRWYEQVSGDELARCVDWSPSLGHGISADWDDVFRLCPTSRERVERLRAERRAARERERERERLLVAEREREREREREAEAAKAAADFDAIAVALDASDSLLARQFRAGRARERDVARAILAPVFDAAGFSADPSAALAELCDACRVERSDWDDTLSREEFEILLRCEEAAEQLPKELHGAQVSATVEVRIVKRRCEYEPAHDASKRYVKVALAWRGLAYYRTRAL
jgi:hypothetical protein